MSDDPKAKGRTRGEQRAYFAGMARLSDERGYTELGRWYRFFERFPEEYGSERRER